MGSLNYRQNNTLDDNWSSLYFVFDSDPYAGGHVKGILLSAKDDVWFTADEMYQYLKEHYYVYEKGTEDDFKAFINSEDYENATVGITWDMKTMEVMFVRITHQDQSTPVYDYGRYMGRTRDEVKDMMTSELGISPMADSEKSIIYRIGNDDIEAITFFFNGQETVQIIQVRLNGAVDKDAVNKELAESYNLLDFANETYYYQTEDMKMRVYYMLSSNIIKYELR